MDRAHPDPPDELIRRYRSGDSSAGEELIARFDKYLRKWVRLLIKGRWNRNDWEIRNFLHMLGGLDLNQASQLLRHRMRAFEREDIEQEVKLALLETAIKYDRISGQYGYVLKRRILNLTHDPLVFSGAWRGRPLGDIPSSTAFSLDIDEAWVEGITCGPGFDELTIDQRRAIQLTKWFGYSIPSAAEIMGVSESTLQRHLYQAIRILQRHFKKEPTPIRPE